MSHHVPPSVYLPWESLPFLELVIFSHVSQVISNYLFPFFSWHLYNVNVVFFSVVPEICLTVFSSFHSLFFILFHGTGFCHYVFQVIYPCFLLQIFCYWFLPVYLSFQLLYCSSLLVFELFWVDVKSFLHLLNSWCSDAQLCPTLCDYMDCNQPSTCIHRVFQARLLEWVAISSSSQFLPPFPPKTSIIFTLTTLNYFSEWLLIFN